MSNKRNVLIMGAAGRDFHNFNVFFRNNPNYQVVAFTATQIPNIDNRRYPSELTGNAYPEGIPIYSETELTDLIKKFHIHDVVFSYSDVSHEYVMHKASTVLAAGANFVLLGANETMLKSSKPVVAIGAVRTGAGKSQTTRAVVKTLRKKGLKVVSVRHPMPYGDLVKQKVQRFASVEDLSKYNCTIEEMEEYEPHITIGSVIYAGVDYEAILKEAEKEADVIVWDGGNNDIPFYKPELMICITDPHRPGHETTYHPGETNLRLADVVILNKIDTANGEDIRLVRSTVSQVNPNAILIEAASPISVENHQLIKGKRALVIEDGPTLTHGEMTYGAGIVAAQKFGASEIIDPRPYLCGTLVETFETYPEIGTLLPAMGYGGKQIQDLEKTIANTPCEVVIIATPIDLRRIIQIKQPTVRVTYELQEIGKPTLEDALTPIIQKIKEHQ
ncbi:MAG: cyclic 2,3-diphosphoglycerate synthase [bacterium]|nr:cyclic 2,3-diphosphoglycerate synthase [bacterium]